jgi:hypothetical protein
MNHRDLILSASRRDRHAFLALPESLQDEIIDQLDAGTLSVTKASELIKARGMSLSHEGVASYYRAVRRERRLVELNSEVPRLVAMFANSPTEDNLKALLNLTLATATAGLADGSVGIKDLDPVKLFGMMPAPKSATETPAAATEAAATKPAGLSDAAAAEIREKILTGK